MKVLTATIALLVSSVAAAQHCQNCSLADSCITTYLQEESKVQKDTEHATQDWQQNGGKGGVPMELSRKGTLALQSAMETQVRLEIERLKECLAKIK